MPDYALEEVRLWVISIAAGDSAKDTLTATGDLGIERMHVGSSERDFAAPQPLFVLINPGQAVATQSMLLTTINGRVFGLEGARVRFLTKADVAAK